MHKSLLSSESEAVIGKLLSFPWDPTFITYLSKPLLIEVRGSSELVAHSCVHFDNSLCTGFQCSCGLEKMDSAHTTTMCAPKIHYSLLWVPREGEGPWSFVMVLVPTSCVLTDPSVLSQVRNCPRVLCSVISAVLFKARLIVHSDCTRESLPGTDHPPRSCPCMWLGRLSSQTGAEEELEEEPWGHLLCSPMWITSHS